MQVAGAAAALPPRVSLFVRLFALFFVRPTAEVSREQHLALGESCESVGWCGEGDLNPHGIAPASTSS